MPDSSAGLHQDHIVLSGLTFYGYHGCEEAERALGQRFLVDVTLALDLEPAGTTDDLTKTVDYSAVYALVRDVVEGSPYRLIETVAERIAYAILSGTIAESVQVRVAKPRAPIKGMVIGDVAVEIERARTSGR
jgi:7,8-dihydroneopterin aldolase/epimerase/oxygenase